MPNPTPAEIQAAIDAMIAQAKQNTDAEDAATKALLAWPARLDAAVAKVLADNPSITATQLKAVTDETAAMKASADPLAAAIVAGTSADPGIPPAAPIG